MKTFLSLAVAISCLVSAPALAQSSRTQQVIAQTEELRQKEIETLIIELNKAQFHLIDLRHLVENQDAADMYTSKKYLAYAQLASASLAGLAVTISLKMKKIDPKLIAGFSFGAGIFGMSGLTSLADLNQTQTAKLLQDIDEVEANINELLGQLEQLKRK